MDFLNPAIYRLALSPNYASTFHDIKDYSKNGYFPAVPGYDLSTGWGSPIGTSLLYALGGCPSGFTFQNGYCVTDEPTCMPVDGLNRKQCQHRIKKCDRVGAKMKWNGTPCPEIVPVVHQKVVDVIAINIADTLVKLPVLKIISVFGKLDNAKTSSELPFPPLERVK